MAEQIRRKKRRRRRRRRLNPSFVVLVLVTAVLLAACVFGISRLFRKDAEPPERTDDTAVESEEPVYEPISATILATGDILMHKPVFNAYHYSDGSYEFEDMFRYIRGYVREADYAVANLETTLCGTDNGYAYSGYPNFNCPDEIVDGLKSAGFDCLLTANNHCYDTGHVGFQRTVETVKSRGLDTLGTTNSAEDSGFLVKNLNGIQIGMVCYTYETCLGEPEPGRVYLNGTAMTSGDEACINTFRTGALDDFYQRLDGQLQAMKEAGAEATVVFLHWGEEYQLTPNAEQRTIAQQLCDMGVDAIVGGHPHVLQPMEQLISRNDPEHSMVCLYSMGNAVSNQRASEMDLKTGNTEDGVLITLTFTRMPDGSVELEKTELLPCWVDMRYRGDRKCYDILPLDSGRKDSWRADFELTEGEYRSAEKSLERSREILGSALAS